MANVISRGLARAHCVCSVRKTVPINCRPARLLLAWICSTDHNLFLNFHDDVRIKLISAIKKVKTDRFLPTVIFIMNLMPLSET